MAPSKQTGEGLLQWAAGTHWGQGDGAALLWKISSLWATDYFLGAVLNDGESMNFAGDTAGQKPLTGQTLLSLAHPISLPEPPTWAPGAEAWGWRLDEGQGQKGSSVEGGCSGRGLWAVLACLLTVFHREARYEKGRKQRKETKDRRVVGMGKRGRMRRS